MRDVEQALANFFASGPLVLADKLGPVLWQLPASTTFDVSLISDFLAHSRAPPARPPTWLRATTSGCDGRAAPQATVDLPLRHALEVRHRSFDDPRFYDLLADHGVANVVSDSPTWPMLDRQTTDFAYVRLHGHSQLYTSGYSAASLDGWADRCAHWARRRSRPRLLRQRRQGAGAPRRRRARPSPPPAGVGRLTTGVRPATAGGRPDLRSLRRPR